MSDRYEWNRFGGPVSDIPDNLESAQITELGGAIGRRASVACRLGQHDLCPKATDTKIVEALLCNCRCHERS